MTNYTIDENGILACDPLVEHLDLIGCTGLTAIPELPSVKTLYLRGCTGLDASKTEV